MDRNHTIKIPFAQVTEVAQGLLSKVPRGKSGFLKEEVSKTEIKTQDSKGRKFWLEILLEVSHTNKTRGEQRQWTPFDKQIRLILNDIQIGWAVGVVRNVMKNEHVEIEMRDGPEDLTELELAQMDQTRLRTLVSMLAHEWTHAADTEANDSDYYQPGDFDAATVEQRRRYLNQDTEVSALTNQILAELGPYVAHEMLLEERLQKSPSWNVMAEPYLDLHQKARVMEAVQYWEAQ